MYPLFSIAAVDSQSHTRDHKQTSISNNDNEEKQQGESIWTNTIKSQRENAEIFGADFCQCGNLPRRKKLTRT